MPISWSDEVIADLGCGTGILLEELLDLVAHDKGEHLCGRSRLSIWSRMRSKGPGQNAKGPLRDDPDLSGINFQYSRRILSQIGSSPSRDSLNRKWPSVLSHRIEGLSSKVLDHLMIARPARTAGRDARFTRLAGACSRLESTLEPAELNAVLEFNRAARFLQDRIGPQDIRPTKAAQIPFFRQPPHNDLLSQTELW